MTMPSSWSAQMCEHANEAPLRCYCSSECYCKDNTCQAVRRMPKQKPGKSVQDVGTPKWLLDLIERTWGRITYDPCASAQYHACDNYDAGPDMEWIDPEHARNGLEQDWKHRSELAQRGLVFWNPPYTSHGKSRMRNWVEKASKVECPSIGLVPASVGSKWWREFVNYHAKVRFLPRFKFIGHDTVYPKDCALLLYGIDFGSEEYDCLNWRLTGNGDEHVWI